MSGIILVCLYVSLTAVAIVLLARVNTVYIFRSRLIDEIHRRNLADLDAGGKYSGHRYKQLLTVSIDEMITRFWKPLHSFYDPTYDWLRDAHGDVIQLSRKKGTE